MGRIKRFRTLTQPREFDRIYKGADRVWHTPWFVLFYRRSEIPQVAFVAGKKVGNAVKRNRAKRRLRALFIETLPQLNDDAYILVAKAPITEVDFSQLRQGWLKALKRCGALYKRKGTDAS